MYFANPKNRDIIERLRVAGVRLEADEEDTSEHTDKLAGKSIVISGVFAHHSRDEYKELIEKHGGKNVGSISSKTSFILAGDNMGPSKLEKAQKLGVTIVSEEEFHKTCREYYKMIGEHGYEAVKDNLEKWLKETSELGCGDDVTVVMAYVDK